MENLTPFVIAVALICGYLFGSIPFGLIAARLGGVGDIRKIGSGNIGATNVLRSGRRDLAAITLVGDFAKGAAAVLLLRFAFHSETGAALAGGAAFLGHLFPVWLKFKGGKGVATFYGVLFAAAWPVGIAAGLTWIAMALLLRYSSLASLTAAAFSPLFAFALAESDVLPAAAMPILWLSAFMAVLIFIRHHENIRRLLKGEEPKIGAKKAAPPTEAA